MQEERIINLEVRFTHQEDLLQELNRIVTQQQKAIDKLQTEVRELALMAASVDTGAKRGSDETPPHY